MKKLYPYSVSAMEDIRAEPAVQISFVSKTVLVNTIALRQMPHFDNV